MSFADESYDIFKARDCAGDVFLSLMLSAMKFRFYLMSFLIAAPWLIGASAGPVAQMGSWLASGCVLVGVLFFQSSRHWPVSIVWAAGVSFFIALLQFSGGAAGLAPWVSESATGEMVANLRQRNQFATLMVIGGLAVWLRYLRANGVFSPNEGFSLHGGVNRNGGLFFSEGLKQNESDQPNGNVNLCFTAVIWVAMAIALFAFATALSGSRTGLLQWLALLALALSWQRSWRANVKWLFGAAVLGFCLGALVGPWAAQLAGHANSGLLSRVDDANSFSRLALWGNVLELIAREPLLGHGWRSLAYAHYSQDFSSTRFMEMLDNAHNLPLHLAVELGLPIALSFCGFVGCLVWKNKPWKETQPDRQLAWGVLLMIGIHSMLEYPLWYGPFFMTALICVGVLCEDTWRNFRDKWSVAGMGYARSAIYLGVCCFAVLLLAATAFVAFDYHRVSQIYLTPEQRSSWYAADPLGAAKKSVFFQSHAKFAELQITPLTKESAARVLELSSELVHWSPEPRIIEKLIESAVMMGLDDVAAFHLKRYRISYPAAHALWAKRAL